MFISTGQGLLGNNMYAYCGNNPIMHVDPSGQFFGLIVAAVVVLVFAVAAANVGTVIASEITVETCDVEPMSDEDFKKYEKKDDTTYGMNREEKISYIRRIRQDEKFAANWTEAEMLREMVYHDSIYEFFLFFKVDSSSEDSYVNQAKHVDFEDKQTVKTYLRRIVGNIIPW